MMKQEKSPESLDQLYSFFCRGKLDEVVAFFDGMSEEKRAEYKPYCLDWCNRINETIKRHQAGEKAPFFQRLETWPHEALKTGILGLVAVADWKAVRRWSSDYLDLQASVKVIASRKPSWTLDMLEGVSRRNPFYYEDQIVCWRMYRQLVKEGSCQSRWSSLMTCFMFEAMYTTTNDCISQSSWKPLNHHGIPILRQLLEDEELITDGIPKLFEMERFPTSWTLTSHDYYHRWKDAIVELIRMNRLETKRVIQWCRTALNRNYTDHQNRWYIELLDRIFKEGLASFDIAMAVDFCKYSSATPKLFGLRRIEELFRSGSNHDEQILSIIPYFLRERKFWAQKGLAILRKIGKRNAKVRSEMLQILMDGTGHPEPAVQEKSIHLLDDFNGWTDKRIAEQLKSVVEQLPSSVKQIVVERLKIGATGSKKKNNDKKGDSSKNMAKKARPSYRPLVAIQTFDELLDLAIKLLERADDANDIERFLDGLARLGGTKPNDFTQKVSALFKLLYRHFGNRVRGIAGKENIYWLLTCQPFWGEYCQSNLYWLMVAWVSGVFPTLERTDELKGFTIRVGQRRYWTDELRERSSAWGPIGGFLVKRFENIACLLSQGESVSLLSTPTFEDGWIDPIVFVKRLEDEINKISSDQCDRILALLRLTPENRDKALKILDDFAKQDEYIDAVRYALGANDAKIGKTACYWIAAARSRNPLEDDRRIEEHFPGYGPDCGLAGRYTLRKEFVPHGRGQVKFKVDWQPKATANIAESRMFPTVGLHDAYQARFPMEACHSALIQTVWPLNPTAAVASLLDNYSTNLDSTSQDTGFRYILSSLSRSCGPLPLLSVLALFITLGLKNNVAVIMATDTLCELIDSARLDVSEAVSPLKTLIALDNDPGPDGCPCCLTYSRRLAPFKTIATRNDQCAEYIKSLTETILPEVSSRDLGGFLELLRELCVQLDTVVESNVCREYLNRLCATDSGKTAKLARDIQRKYRE